MSSKNNKKRNSQPAKKHVYFPMLDKSVSFYNEIDFKYLLLKSRDVNLIEIRAEKNSELMTRNRKKIFPTFTEIFLDSNDVLTESLVILSSMLKSELADFVCFKAFDHIAAERNVKFLSESDLHEGRSLENLKILHPHQEIDIQKELTLRIRRLFAFDEKLLSSEVIRELEITKEIYYACIYQHLLWVDISSQSVDDSKAIVMLGSFLDTYYPLELVIDEIEFGDSNDNKVYAPNCYMVDDISNDLGMDTDDFFDSADVEYIT